MSLYFFLQEFLFFSTISFLGHSNYSNKFKLFTNPFLNIHKNFNNKVEWTVIIDDVINPFLILLFIYLVCVIVAKPHKNWLNRSTVIWGTTAAVCITRIRNGNFYAREKYTKYSNAQHNGSNKTEETHKTMIINLTISARRPQCVRMQQLQ